MQPQGKIMEFSKSFAIEADRNDVLKPYRTQFAFPMHRGEPVIYFMGNSLGLKPKAVDQAIQTELDDWSLWGVEGHFNSTYPWYSYHELLADGLAQLAGAKNHEVVAMNGLTNNLHLLMASFYRPTATRFKIICEKKAFPSDQYVIESQLQHHGHTPEDALIEMAPRSGEHTLRIQDIIKTIHDFGDEVCLVFLGGVNYYTGQWFDMEKITQAAHDVGAIAGFDLAHAFGNVPLHLNAWKVDFAAWCSYKYLNSGPGGVAGAFIHETHGLNPDTPRLAGWWGYDKSTRFKMEPGFKPVPGAEGWQLSNAPVLSMAAHRIALNIHCEAGMDALRRKSILLTNYLEFVLNEVKSHSSFDFEIITPKNENERGAQLSLLLKTNGKEWFNKLSSHGVMADWREPNVIRMAAVPLYNSFEDVYRLGKILQKIS